MIAPSSQVPADEPIREASVSSAEPCTLPQAEGASSGRGRSETCPYVAWVSLDEGDNEPTRFWSYVIAALRTVQPIAAGTAFEAALAALQSPHPPPVEELLTGMINEIAEVPDSCALVLDDYHAI